MRKSFAIAIMLILIFVCTACREKEDDNQNFLGGYGEIRQGAYMDSYTSGFFEDDIYIYFNNFKINKESKQWVNLCDVPGCRHDHSGCVEYKYANKVFPGYNQIFYIKGKELYEIDKTGSTKSIAVFATDRNGVSYAEDVKIESVKPLANGIVSILCGGERYLYNIKSDKRLYVDSGIFCGNDTELYYYDEENDGVVRADAQTLETELIADSKRIYPCFCTEDAVYCNTETGVICRIDKDNDIEVCLSEEGMRYILLGTYQDRMYYLLTDVDMISGEYTICDLYSSLLDGTENTKIDIQNLKPDMGSFWGKDAFYLLETGRFGGVQSVFVYHFDTETGNQYVIEDSGETEPDIVTSEELIASSEEGGGETKPLKSFAISTNFYTEEIDPLTGNQSQVSQKTIPFQADGQTLKTTFYYNIEATGYPSEGDICLFVMCDGILQPLSVDGSDFMLINKVKYKNNENMQAELEFSLENPSDNHEIIIGYYLSDSIITDDFQEFGKHNEAITCSRFAYETADGYVLNEKTVPEINSDMGFYDVYTFESEAEKEQEEEYGSLIASDLVLLSDCIPIRQQTERWNFQFAGSDMCYTVFHSQSGSYNMYLLIDNVPVPMYEGENCIRCNIVADKDTAVIKSDINELLKDNEKHIAKILIYDRRMGIAKLYPPQIIQKED